ncbi:MAG TPA: hypothetical protein VE733_24120 [Streptosporangiaceae bacterium]|jgi:hypothetical protein|nr:hypothetical protein [Streptosporangiaceae bacterium]
MHPRCQRFHGRHPGRRVSRSLGRAALPAVAAGLGISLLTACGTSSASSTSSASRTCGTTRTAANVPVIVKVSQGAVSCTTALRVESSYAALIRAGKVRGNGGGAPVKVSGWTCQGLPTPEVLRTGETSTCRAGGAEVLEILRLGRT